MVNIFHYLRQRQKERTAPITGICPLVLIVFLCTLMNVPPFKQHNIPASSGKVYWFCIKKAKKSQESSFDNS